MESDTESKMKLLKKYLKLHKNLSIQGSTEWYDDRKYVIGGSEMAAITGCGKFSTIHSLIAQKIGLSSFNGNTATRWGSLFENITEMTFNILFLKDKKIYSLGSVPHKTVPNHRYSPDGLCLLELGGLQYIILLEFKSPLNSVPEKKIPTHYLPQIKSGMSTINIVDFGVFVSNMYRKCTLDQLNFNTNYDTVFHKSDKNKRLTFDSTIAHGIILFSIPKQKVNEFLAFYLAKLNELASYPEFDDLDDCNQESNVNVEDPKEPVKECDFNQKSLFQKIDNIIESMYRGLHHSITKNASSMHRMFKNDLLDSGLDSELDSGLDIGMDIGMDDANAGSTIDDKNMCILRRIYNTIRRVHNTAYKELKIADIDANALTSQLMDLGSISNDDFEGFLEMIKPETGDSFIDVKYVKPNINADMLHNVNANKSRHIYISERLNSAINTKFTRYNFIKTIKNYIMRCGQDKIPIAVLPWKLFRSSVVYIDKEPGYVSNYSEKINETVETIKKLNDLPENEKLCSFQELFPDSHLAQNGRYTPSYVGDSLKNLL